MADRTTTDTLNNLLTTKVDPILALGSILADELHGCPIPVLVLNAVDFARLRTGDQLGILANGAISIGRSG